MSVNEEGLTTTAGSCIAAGEGEVGRHAVTGEAPGPFVGQKLGGIPGSQGCPFKVRSGEQEVVWTVWSKAVLVQLGWADPLEMKAGDVVFFGRVLWHADLMGASIDDRGPSREPAKNQAGSFNERQGPQTSS